VRRHRRQLQARSSLPLLGSEILGNGDGLRAETDAHWGMFFCCLPNRSVKTCLYSPFFLLLFLSARPFSRIRWLKHLVLQYVRNYMYSTDTLLFFTSCSAFCSCAPGFAVCPCFIASYLSTLYVSYISAGCLVRNKATLVIHVGMVSR
jgi:hypothetical protein